MPGLKILLESKQKSGKTCFMLSACRLGPMAVADTEFAWHNYVMKHPEWKPESGSTAKRFTPRPHVKKMLGIPAEEWPVIALLQSNDQLKIKAFLLKAAKDPKTLTLGLDSASVLWDLASATVEGRQDWGRAKQPLRALQYLAMGSGKHYMFSAHLNPLFNDDMTKKIGEFPWSEKKDPHWADYELKLTFGPKMETPQVMIIGERSGGRFKPGSMLKKCDFPTFLKMIYPDGEEPEEMEGECLDGDEVIYRTQVAQANETPGQAFNPRRKA